MKAFATPNAVNTVSNVNLPVVVFPTRGSATAIMTVPMDRMKTLLSVTLVSAIKTHNSGAKTANVFQNCGSVTSMTIAATILTNRRTGVETGTAAPVGRSARPETTTAVFPVGSSAMER